MSKIFEEDSDSEVEIKTNNEYAKNYDAWRKKEEINRLKTKYGEENLNLDEEGSSSSSDDDEDGIELTEAIEKQFFKTLSCLKNKDPRIYDKSVSFFDDRKDDDDVSKKKNKKQQPVFIKDYERKIILEKGGIVSDDEDAEQGDRSPTYVAEQNQLKENLKAALKDVEQDNDENEWGGLFKARQKTKEEKSKEEADYKEWLAGQRKNVDDKEVEMELKPLKDYWNNPKLDEGEKFLRDYILKKKFLDEDNEDYIPTYDEIVHDSDESLSNDEEEIERQEEFEHKYNFRFEEPDQEFIKRYPRTVENSLRKKDDKRKIKRAETKERKQKEKEEKMAELKKLQELKRKEIEEKIQKLKEITGNTDVGFQDEDIDGDFDPEAHDRRMQALFADEFYQGPEEEQKPEFPDLDEQLEIENWERWEGQEENDQGHFEPNCEDDNFIMDADYDPTQASTSSQQELVENSKSRKKRRRKSKFAQALSQPKPKYDPNDKNYEKYFEEYYKLDCEDVIGDIPCRFKYRTVIPNDFGLTTEEILLAKDRELNKWCSLKKAVQIRPEHVEKYEQIAYAKKAKNLELKKKILPSLFSDGPEEESSTEYNRSENTSEEIISNNNKKASINERKKPIKKGKKADKKEDKELSSDDSKPNENTKIISNNHKKKKQSGTGKAAKKKEDVKLSLENLNKNNTENDGKNEISQTSIESKKKKTNNNVIISKEQSNKEKLLDDSVNSESNSNKKFKKNKQDGSATGKNKMNNHKQGKKRKLSDVAGNNKKNSNKKFKKNNTKDGSTSTDFSDARLAAFGINPKKFKNKLKYGNK